MTVKVRYKLGQGKRSSRAKPVTRAARMLALAHLIERKVEAGELESYAHAAKALNLSKARVSQIMGLLNLPISVQEGILTATMALSERRLRDILNSR